MTIDFTPSWLDTDLASYRDTVERFVETEMQPGDEAARHCGHVGHEIWRLAGALGMLCVDIPEAYGGAGLLAVRQQRVDLLSSSDVEAVIHVGPVSRPMSIVRFATCSGHLWRVPSSDRSQRRPTLGLQARTSQYSLEGTFARRHRLSAEAVGCLRTGVDQRRQSCTLQSLGQSARPENLQSLPSRMDARETAPSTERNRQPILEVLTRVLPPRGLVLEIGSGTGQHVAHFAKALPGLIFQPSEMDLERHPSIEAWTAAGKLSNVKPPLAIDVTKRPWPVSAADAVVCINVIHISPWEATLGLMAGASSILPDAGMLVTYGPYMRGGAHTSQSNQAFDESLRARNPLWGVRDIDTVVEVAGHEGLALVETVPMPANNLTLVWRKVTSARTVVSKTS